MLKLDDFVIRFARELRLPLREILRIQQLVQRHPRVNWDDALGESQLRSKLELCRMLHENDIRPDFIQIHAGWIGLTAYLLRLEPKAPKKIQIIDLDPVALAAARDFLSGVEVSVLQVDVNTAPIPDDVDLVVNTSCEHLRDFSSWLDRIPQGVLFACQSNNMVGIHAHINCSPDLIHFQGYFSKRLMIDTSVVDMPGGNGWQRFTVLGR